VKPDGYFRVARARRLHDRATAKPISAVPHAASVDPGEDPCPASSAQPPFEPPLLDATAPAPHVGSVEHSFGQQVRLSPQQYPEFPLGSSPLRGQQNWSESHVPLSEKLPSLP